MIGDDGFLEKKAIKLAEFTPDDLRTFFELKTYQILTRGQYDPSVSSMALFATAFRNLKIDIYRIVVRLQKKGVFPDSHNVVSALNEGVNYYSAENSPLTETEKEILEIVSSNLEDGDKILLPLAKVILG